MAREPIVITGMGVVSSLGLDLDTLFKALMEQRCGAREVPRFRQEGLRFDHAAVVEREPVVQRLAAGEAGLPWASAMAVVALRAALADAGLAPALGETPLAVSCSIGSPAAIEQPGVPWAELDPTEPRVLAAYAQGTLVAAVAAAVGAAGPVSCLTTTCAGGNYALGAALDRLRAEPERGVAVAGGVEELSAIPYTAFHQLRALGRRCRPFDRERDGLLFGEGAAFLVLETLSSAVARRARVYAEMLGVGYSNDAHHLVAPDPDGAGAALAMRRALAESGIAAAEVGYVNAHGTATTLNDAAEARALNAVFDGAPPAVSSTKGATGHLMGAASALEAVITALAIHRGLLPPTTGLAHVDEPLGVTPLQGAPRAVAVEVALSSGLGFGGNNAVLALGRAGRERQHTRRSNPRQVYIQGGAALAGALLGLEAVWAHIQTGTPLTEEEALASFDPSEILGKRGLRHVDRGALLLASVLEHDLASWPSTDKARAGAVFGGAFPAYSSIIALLREIQRNGPSRVNPMLVPFATANCAPSWWLLRRGITGFNGSLGSGECAGLDAVILAATQLRHGRIDAAVAGGVEAHTAELWQGLARNDRRVRPLAEGVGAVVLDTQPEGAWARLAGAASAFDNHTPHRAVERAVRQALYSAGLAEADVAVTHRPHAGPLPAGRVLALDATLGDTLGAGSALALLAGALLLQRGAGTPRSVLVVGEAADGYATAVLLDGAAGG